MQKHILAAALILPFSLAPALAEGLTIIGSRGGTAEVERDCVRTKGQSTCTTGTVFTGTGGETATKSRVRTTVPGQSETEISVTGPKGETRTRKRLVIWGD